MDTETPTKNLGGRPLKFESVEEFDKQVDVYFAEADFPTITGLAVHLNTSRETLSDYKRKEGFSDSIKRALDKCEAAVELRALTGKANPVMSIFTLKNNYGWKDKQEVESTVQADVTTNGKDLQPVDQSTVDNLIGLLKEQTAAQAKGE